jgi:hypothetical protein
MQLSEKNFIGSNTRPDDKPKGGDTPPHETLLGAWTVFTLPSPSLKPTLPGMDLLGRFQEILQSLPIIWRFFSDTIMLGPWLFVMYFGSTTLASIFSVLQLYNETSLLSLVSLFN